ncbi:hypothetical protein VNO80_29213 [Phaseolus coccineus]|uniref:Uncharacterized protein n=1 Tax=Phaseolus coccineus TaxID=3886 RepID=A0AAN9LB10_PHACN
MVLPLHYHQDSAVLVSLVYVSFRNLGSSKNKADTRFALCHNSKYEMLLNLIIPIMFLLNLDICIFNLQILFSIQIENSLWNHRSLMQLLTLYLYGEDKILPTYNNMKFLRSLGTEETGTLTISIHICMEVGNNDMALKAKWER